MAQSMLLPLGSSQVTLTWTPLETRIRQIESQKGSFRTVTEASLQEDIEKLKAGNKDGVSFSEESEEESESPEAKQKKLWEAREEMMKQLLRAQNETLTALDSLSLLTSGHATASEGAKSSMSPALSSAVPHGTLDAYKVRTAQSSSSAKQQSESLHSGYRLQGLQNALDKVQKARDRLRQQAEHESAFWKQVADLSAQGLVISRLPQDSRTIGVHFGFPEAAPNFRNRGFAVLRTDQNGQLCLDKNAASSKRYTVQISTIKGGNITSRSKVSALHASDTSLAATVASLRRSLFEEELFSEIGREARTIANQGVVIKGKKIHAEVSDGQTMQIELVQHDEQTVDDGLMGNYLADGIALCLRGLLSEGHKQHFTRRSQPPNPLMPNAAPLPEYALLKPLLSHLRHQNLVSALQDYCDSLKATMEAAGLFFQTKHASMLSASLADGCSSQHALFLDSLLAPAESVFEVVLPTSRKLEVKTRTHLAPPAYGTVFTVYPIEYGSHMVTSQIVSDLDAVKTTICYALTTDIIELIANAGSISDTSSQHWKKESGHDGELRLHDACLHIKIHLDTSLAARYHKYHDSTAPAEGVAWVWRAGKISVAPAEAGSSQESLHLMEVVEELSKTVIDRCGMQDLDSQDV